MIRVFHCISFQVNFNYSVNFLYYSLSCSLFFGILNTKWCVLFIKNIQINVLSLFCMYSLTTGILNELFRFSSNLKRTIHIQLRIKIYIYNTHAHTIHMQTNDTNFVFRFIINICNYRH